MEVAKVTVSGVRADVKDLKPITSGMVGATVSFTFEDPLWNELTKTVVYKTRHGVRDDLEVGEDGVSKIPPELLICYGLELKVGVYGVNDAGDLVIPTVWASLDFIKAGADPSGDPGTDPSLPPWHKLRQDVDELDERVQTLEEHPAAIQPDWNQNDPTQPDYVRNRTHWAEVGEPVEIVPETTLTTTEDSPGEFNVPAGVLSFEVGKTYIVTYNGTEYSCVAVDAGTLVTDGAGTVVIGNYALALGGGDTGEPFVAMYLPGEGTLLIDFNGALSITASVSVVDEVVHKLDRKFLPYDIGGGAEPFVVTLSPMADGSGTYKADKTIAEVEAAYNKGNILYCSIPDLYAYLPCGGTNGQGFVFSGIRAVVDGKVNTCMASLVNTDDTELAFVYSLSGVTPDKLPTVLPNPSHLYLRNALAGKHTHIARATYGSHGTDGSESMYIFGIANPYALTINGKTYDGSAEVDMTGDIVPAPAAASVGQTIVVKAVDDNGKPTEWECADNFSGSWNDLTDRPFYESDTVMVGSTAVSYGVIMNDGSLLHGNQASKRDKNGKIMAINARPELVRCAGIITVNGSMDMAANFNKVTTISADLGLGGSGVAVYELTSDTYGDTAKITLTTNRNDDSIIFAFENCAPVMANLYGAEWEYGVAKQLDEKYLPDSVKGGGDIVFKSTDYLYIESDNIYYFVDKKLCDAISAGNICDFVFADYHNDQPVCYEMYDLTRIALDVIGAHNHRMEFVSRREDNKTCEVLLFQSEAEAFEYYDR